MSRLLKRIQKILNNPGGVSYDELVWLLERFSRSDRSPGTGGSHVTYVVVVEGSPKIITVPKPKKGRSVGRAYVEEVIELLNLEDWYDEHS